MFANILLTYVLYIFSYMNQISSNYFIGKLNPIRFQFFLKVNSILLIKVMHLSQNKHYIEKQNKKQERGLFRSHYHYQFALRSENVTL